MDQRTDEAILLDTSLAARQRVFATVPSDLPTIVHHGRFFASSDSATQPVFTHVGREPGEHCRLTFADLDRKARAIAAAIQAKGGSGKPVLIVLDPGNDYAAALYGCLYARAIAVPVYPPQMLRLQHTLSRLQAIIANAGATLMLSSRAVIGDQLGPIWGLGRDAAIAVDEIDVQQADGWDEVLPSAEDIAILQYTSGSTGNPQGVVLRHRSVLSNLKALLHQFHFPNVRCVQWVPPYHDMGLVGGILVPVYVGVETVLLSPVDFVSDPLLWLRCIDYYRGTSNGAPNFGYELCVRKIKDADCEGLDLSSWKVAIAGAEPVRHATLKRFADKFEPFGFDPDAFSPAYGLAETTLVVSGSQVGDAYETLDVDAQKLQQGLVETTAADDAMTLVSSGTTVLGMEIEIVDPDTRRSVQAGAIGEIWVRGDSLADGYWREPERTAERFGATLVDKGHDDYFRTGDLGAMINGELFVTGRRKELIIVAGKNLYPHDVEEIVQATSPALKAGGGTAFGVNASEGEQLVVVQEMTRPKKFDRDCVLRQAVAALAESLQVVPQAVVLVRAGSLPKTSSGKLRRIDVRQAFLNGELQEISRWESGVASDSAECTFVLAQTDTEKQIAVIWQAVLGVKQVGRNDDFFYLGGSSLLVSQMITAVNECFQINLPLQTVFHHPTLQQFGEIVDQSDRCDSPGIVRSSFTDDKPHPLSAAQQRIWLLSRLDQSDAFLNVPLSIELVGTIDPDVLQGALNELVKKHAVLRTQVVESNAGVSQRIVSNAQVVVQSFASDDGDRTLDFRNAGFDLHQAPLMRAALIRLPCGNERIDLVFHHLVCDAGSVAILLSDLQTLLAGDHVSEGRLRYVDYVAWEQSEWRRTLSEASLQYWVERLREMPALIELPSDDSASDDSLGDTTGGHAPVTTSFDGELASQIRRLAIKSSVTPSMVFLTAFQTVLARYCGANDFGILMPSSNRPANELERVVGCYVNPIVYRAEVNPALSIQAGLTATRDRLLSDLRHADAPFQAVVDAIGPDRTTGRMPLAQVMFLYQPSLKTIDSLCSAQVQSVTPDYSAVTAYDLSLVIQPTDAGFDVTAIHGQHCGQVIANRIIESIKDWLQQAVAAIQQGGPTTLADLKIPSADERAFLNHASQGSDLEIGETCLLSRLRHHATTQPSEIAIDDDQASISYGDLDALSSELASQLKAVGVRRGSLVGIQMQRGVAMVATILGIWKAGGGYVPLSDDLPQSRIDDMIADADLSLVIDDAKYESIRQTKLPAARILSWPRSNDLAYVIYTSGSTGKPKGVAIEHQSVANLLASFATRPGFAAGDSVLALTTLSFDISVLELFLPMWCGAKSRVTAQRVAADPEAVIDTIDSSAVTHVQATPSTLRVLLSSSWKPRPGLVVFSGGEPLTSDIADELLSAGCVLWNVYGPTETTVWSAIESIENANDITIGQPIANTELVVVDEEFQQMPIGVPGELCIGGRGVGRGYLNRDELTREKFVTVGGRRLYRTGDIARLRGDGRLEFLARNDRQVKLRGFRIELDEIESVLQQHESVRRAAVVMDDQSGTHPRLVGFCQLTAPCECMTATMSQSIESFVGERLPSYMVPVVSCVQDIPTSPAGKTDYNALVIDAPCLPTNVGFQAAETPLESSLAEAWCDILNCQEVGRHDNFFHLGGNSLIAAQLFARLRDQFAIELPLREVYQRPTIALLAELILQKQSLQQPGNLQELLDHVETLSEEEALRLLGTDLLSGEQEEA